MAALRRLVGPNPSLSHASLLPPTFLICCRGIAFRPLVGGISGLFRGLSTIGCTSHLPSQLKEKYGPYTGIPFFTRPISSKASEQPGQTGSKKQPEQSGSETRKDISTVEDPFDAPTYNIPEKPVSYLENADYYPQPREYEVFNKALKRIEDDGQVSVRIGSPITGYGQESGDRNVCLYIPNRIWTDEDGVEHVEINFHIRF